MQVKLLEQKTIEQIPCSSIGRAAGIVNEGETMNKVVDYIDSLTLQRDNLWITIYSNSFSMSASSKKAKDDADKAVKAFNKTLYNPAMKKYKKQKKEQVPG